MLIACYLHGDLSAHDLWQRIGKLAVGVESLAEHPLTSKAFLHLYEHASGERSSAELKGLFADLFEATRPSRSRNKT